MNKEEFNLTAFEAAEVARLEDIESGGDGLVVYIDNKAEPWHGLRCMFSHGQLSHIMLSCGECFGDGSVWLSHLNKKEWRPKLQESKQVDYSKLKEAIKNITDILEGLGE